MNTADNLETLLQRIPRLPLSAYPTPLLKASHLQQAIGGPDIWFKRDDLISFGLGGNKIRGLEVIVAEKLRKSGKHCYAIPRGGACPLGALDHVFAVLEVYRQCLAQSLKPDLIVLAGSSGGTYAGDGQWLGF